MCTALKVKGGELLRFFELNIRSFDFLALNVTFHFSAQPVVEQAVQHGNGATGIVQVALQLSEEVCLVSHLILLYLCKLLGLAAITGLGWEEQDQGHHWLGDQGQ